MNPGSKRAFVIFAVTIAMISVVLSGCLVALIPLPPPPPRVNVSGVWSGVYAFTPNQQINNFTMNLTQTGTSLTGTFNDQTLRYSRYNIVGNVIGYKINFVVSISQNEYLSFAGSVYGGNWGMSGDFSCYYNGVQTYQGAWSAEK